MLLVKAIIKPSSIAGTGLFANEDIKNGTKIWLFKKYFDLRFSKEEITKSHLTQKEIETYAYLSKASGKYIYPVDDAKYMNHSSNPNVRVIFGPESEEDINIAARDIGKGEELTIDYEKFDQEFESYKDSYK